MSTQTTTTKSNTQYTYNNDLSSISGSKPKYDTAKLMSVDDYAKSKGYNTDYRFDDLFNNIYKKTADDKLAQALYGVDVARNEFGQAMNKTNRSVVDALRSETNSAIASGTSRAISDANVLKAILGLQQESVADATALAQEGQKAYVDYGANLGQARLDASTDSWNRISDLAAKADEIFKTQQASLDSKYTADSSSYAALAAALLSRVLSQNTTQTESSVIYDTPTDTSGVDRSALNYLTTLYNSGYSPSKANAARNSKSSKVLTDIPYTDSSNFNSYRY